MLKSGRLLLKTLISVFWIQFTGECPKAYFVGLSPVDSFLIQVANYKNI